MLSPGQHIQERFVVEELVGRGGLAEVYRVRHLQLGSVHALKLLLFRKKSLADRLLLEGRIQAQLRHPNVVAVTDVVRHDGQYGLLMEYVDNITLEDLIDTRGAIPTDEALRIIAPVLAGVHAAHQAGVLHRDLKPANVLLAKVAGGLVPKVSDFGIAKVLDEGLDGSTRENVAMGTPGYMAPEQVLDARSVDARTDVFALAGMVYELIAGRRPFADETGEVTLRSTLEGTFLPLEDVVEGVSDVVSNAVGHGLARDREDRPADVAGFAEELLTEHPDLLAMVLGATVSAPLALDPGRPSRFSNPGTTTADAGAQPPGQGPTLMPAPGAAAGSRTFDGGRLAQDSVSTQDAEESDRRRAPPLFWTGALLAVGLLLLGSTIGVLVAGPALGWFVSPEGAVARKAASDEGDIDGEPKARGTVSIREGGVIEVAEAGMDTDGEAAESANAGSADAPADPQRSGTSAGGGMDADPTPGGSGGPVDVSAEPTTDGVADGTADDTDSASQAADPEPSGDTDVAADTSPAAVEDEAASTSGQGQADDGTTDGGSTAEPAGVTETAPEPPPARKMVLSPDAFMAASWDGKVFRQPFTLRVLQERGGDVVGEGRIVLGAQQRIVRLTGSYDPYTGALYLKETNGNLVLRGLVSGTSIRGTYEREGKGSPERLELMRR